MDEEEEEAAEESKKHVEMSFCRISNSAQKPLSQTKIEKKLLKIHINIHLEKISNP